MICFDGSLHDLFMMGRVFKLLLPVFLYVFYLNGGGFKIGTLWVIKSDDGFLELNCLD